MMKNIMFYMFMPFLALLCVHLYGEEQIDSIRIDPLGVPMVSLKNSESGTISQLQYLDSDNVLFKLYSQKKEFEKLLNCNVSDEKSLLLLSAIYSRVATIKDKIKIRDSVLSKTFDLNPKESSFNFPRDILLSGFAKYVATVSPEFAFFVMQMLVDKYGIPASPADECASIPYFTIYYARVFETHSGGRDTSAHRFALDGISKVILQKNSEAVSAIRILIQANELPDFTLPLVTIEKTHPYSMFLDAIAQKPTYSLSDKDRILKFANENFPPSYLYAAQISEKEKHFEDAAFYRYMAMRAPYFLCKFNLTSLDYEAFEVKILPALMQFSDMLIRAKRYSDAFTLGEYVKAITAPCQNIVLEGIRFNNKLKEKIGTTIVDGTQRRKLTLNALSMANKGFFVIDDFETRFLSTFENNSAQKE